MIAHTIAALIAAGAHDAWATPIVMKKGRPAHTVHVLCDPSAAPLLGALLLRETGSLGLRGTELRRWPQQRSEREVNVDGHMVRAKVALGRVKVEYDDAAAAAAALGRPLRDVLGRGDGARRTRRAMIPPFVDAAFVAAHPDAVLADVRWYLDGRDGRAAYEAGTSAGAVWVDLDTPTGCPRPTGDRGPSPASRHRQTFAQRWARWASATTPSSPTTTPAA